MYLNNANEIIGIHKLSKGGITATIIDIRILLATALKCLATGIIVSHNHPSGNLVPSKLDKDLTEKLKAACKLLDINLLDHVIIVPDNAYFSFVDEGLLC
jgi:DNA repair protein RadC